MSRELVALVLSTSGAVVAQRAEPMPPWSVGQREVAVARLVASGEASVPALMRVIEQAPGGDAYVALRGLVLIGPGGKSHRPAMLQAQEVLRPHLAEATTVVDRQHSFASVSRAKLTTQERFFAYATVLAAMDMPAECTVAESLAVLNGNDWARACAAAIRLSARGTDAGAALPTLLELRARIHQAMRAIEPAAAKTNLGLDRAMTNMGLLRALPVRIGADAFTLPGSAMLTDLIDHAVVAVDPRHPSTIPVHMARLRFGSRDVRRMAAQVLGEIGPSAAEATSLLCTASRDLDLGVAREAITALGRIGEPSPAVRHVLRLAATHTDKDLAARASAALAELDREMAAPAQRR